MGILNKQTIDIINTIGFDERYIYLSKKYSKCSSNYIVSLDKIKEILNATGYKFQYYKNENFFKINLGKYKEYSFYCHIIIYNNTNFIDAGIYVMKKKSYVAGSLLNVMYREITNKEYIEKLYLENEEEMMHLIKYIITLSKEFKKGFETINDCLTNKSP